MLKLMPIILFGLLALFFWMGLSLNPREIPSVKLNQKLPVFEIPVLGDKQRFLSANNLKGHPLVLHIFASWCEACAEEQVFLYQLAAGGLPLYGINYKDDPDEALRWLQTWGNPYRLIGSDRNGRVGIDLGVYGTPETFLIDSEGVIRYRHVGPLNAAIWEKVLLPYWQRLS